MDPLTVALVSGVVAAVAGGIIGSAAAVIFSRRAEHAKDLAGRRFRIYMALLDLASDHFWVTTHEFHGEEIPREIRERVQGARYKIADELRQADDLEELPEIVQVLFSLGYTTEVERADAIQALTDRMAKLVNPRFSAAAKAVAADAARLMEHDMVTGDNEWMKRRRKIEPWW